MLDGSSAVGGGVSGCSGLEQDDPGFDPPLWWPNPFSTVFRSDLLLSGCSAFSRMSLMDLVNLAGLNGVGMAFFLHLIGDVTSLEGALSSCFGLLEEEEEDVGSTRGKRRSLSERLETPLPMPFVSGGKKEDSTTLGRLPDSIFWSSLTLKGRMTGFFSSTADMSKELERLAIGGKRFGLSRTTGLSFTWLPS